MKSEKSCLHYHLPGFSSGALSFVGGFWCFDLHQAFLTYQIKPNALPQQAFNELYDLRSSIDPTATENHKVNDCKVS